MRYMIIIKATPGSEAGDAPSEALIDEMATFHEELARAGVLLEGMGLHPSREGWRVQHAADGNQAAAEGKRQPR